MEEERRRKVRVTLYWPITKTEFNATIQVGMGRECQFWFTCLSGKIREDPLESVMCRGNCSYEFLHSYRVLLFCASVTPDFHSLSNHPLTRSQPTLAHNQIIIIVFGRHYWQRISRSRTNFNQHYITKRTNKITPIPELFMAPQLSFIDVKLWLEEWKKSRNRKYRIV